jgi:hypothetical protein
VSHEVGYPVGADGRRVNAAQGVPGVALPPLGKPRCREIATGNPGPNRANPLLLEPPLAWVFPVPERTKGELSPRLFPSRPGFVERAEQKLPHTYLDYLDQSDNDPINYT